MPEPMPIESNDSPFELEELSEPIAVPASPEPLAAGLSLDTPAGPLRIDRFLDGQGAVNVYEAAFSDGRPALLRETQDGGSAELLRHEFEILRTLHCPMFLQAFACWEQDGRTYLATEPAGGRTLADALRTNDLTSAELVSVLAQVAYAVSHLHSQGWLHLALRPAVIMLGKPVRILDLSCATRAGGRPPEPFSFAGYTAPEIATDAPLDARADIYSLGAILFHGTSGYPIPESGVAWTGWQPKHPIGGIPQILHRCLGPPDTRYATMGELHQDLLRLARRCVPRVRYECASATTIGLEPTRTVNQDAYGLVCMQSETEDAARSWAVATVADGMGGMAAGEVASTVAVAAVMTQAMAALASFPPLSAAEQARMTADWVRTANEKVCEALEARQARGGCTLVCALVLGRRLTIAHVGDCRIYLSRRDGSLRTLTRDHSLAMSLVMQGELDLGRLRTSPDRSNVTRSLGERKRLPEHYVDTLSLVTGTESLELETGDTLLLCSDGLWEPVDEQAMAQTLAEHAADVQAAAEALIASALEHGGPDNATVSLLRIEESPRAFAKV